MKRSLGKTVAFSTIAIVLPVILFFGLSELALRLFYHPLHAFNFYTPHSLSVVSRDPDLGYRLRSNFNGSAYASHVRTNRLGYRGADFDPSGRPDLRVVALGDSCTFGFGATDDEHTYPAELEKILKQRIGGAEVINAGVVGYSSFQSLKMFQTKIVPIHADVVLIYVGWNDMGNSLLPDWTPTIKQTTESSGWWPGGDAPYIVLFLSDLISRWRSHEALGFKDEAIEAYRRNVDTLIESAQNAGVEPVLLSWPTRVASQIDDIRLAEIIPQSGVTFATWFEFYGKYQTALRNIAERKKTHLIDLAGLMNGKDSKDHPYFFDEIHLSDSGNLEAARFIAEALDHRKAKGVH